jgi:ABC-type nitrate/sulfonate/bicarbonate transport system permease component
MAANGGRIALATEEETARPWLTRESVAPVVAGVALLAFWEIYVRAELPDFVARPSGIIMAIPAMMGSAKFWSDALASFGSIIEGVALGSVAGILVGVAMGRVREVNWFLSTYIRALYALPLIALVPIVILWVGYQPAARLTIVALSAFLPVAVTTADGTRAISKEYLDVGQMFGAKARHVWLASHCHLPCHTSWRESRWASRGESRTRSLSKSWRASRAWGCRSSSSPLR